MDDEPGLIQGVQKRLDTYRTDKKIRSYGIDLQTDTAEIQDQVLAGNSSLLIELDGRHITDSYIKALNYAISTHPQAATDEIQLIRTNLFSLATRDCLDSTGEVLCLPRIPDEMPGRSNFRGFLYQRAFAMRLYVIAPQMLTDLLRNRVVGVHGSASGSLWGVLEHGLRPQDTLAQLDAVVATGEHVFGSASLNREYVSFNQWNDREADNSARSGGPITEQSLEVHMRAIEERLEGAEENLYTASGKRAIEHARKTLAFLRKKSKTHDETMHEVLIRENFPVLYCARLEPGRTYDPDPFSEQRDIIIPHSSVSAEFGIRGGIGLESIPLILVPADKVEEVRNLVHARCKGRPHIPQVGVLQDYQKALDGPSF